jgi:REP element-mobilizing transposase RayT
MAARKNRKIQQSLFDQKPKRGRPAIRPPNHFGGIYLETYNPKSKRPMDSKKALHVVLKSSKAVGSRSFKNSQYEMRIWEIISTHAKKLDIRIYEYANGGNHLHLLLRAKHRDDYNAFIRTVAGLIARLVAKTEKGKPLKEKFWDARPFSRVVSFSKKEFNAAKTYLLRNMLEALGWLPYQSRNQQLTSEKREWLAGSLANQVSVEGG